MSISNLQQFLNSNPVEGMTAEIPISDRLKDNDGKLFTFKIKAMTQSDHESARKSASKFITKGGGQQLEFDSKKYNSTVIIENTLEPNFKDAESIKAVGCITPEQYLAKVLLAGEIDALSLEIAKFSGFGKDINDLISEAKN